jgi:hypothetical protein
MSSFPKRGSAGLCRKQEKASGIPRQSKSVSYGASAMLDPWLDAFVPVTFQSATWLFRFEAEEMTPDGAKSPHTVRSGVPKTRPGILPGKELVLAIEQQLLEIHGEGAGEEDKCPAGF